MVLIKLPSKAFLKGLFKGKSKATMHFPIEAFPLVLLKAVLNGYPGLPLGLGPPPNLPLGLGQRPLKKDMNPFKKAFKKDKKP